MMHYEHTGTEIAFWEITLAGIAPMVMFVLGPMPLDGEDGTDGLDGMPGTPGAPGATGATGAIGPTGLAGMPGLDGDDGLDGLPGTPGAPGSPGATGATGPAGPAGLAGMPGTDGEDGYDGMPGLPGPMGPAGPAGGGGAAYLPFTRDLGIAQRSGTFDLTGLVGLTAGRVVNVVQTGAAIPSKGNATDEPEMDSIDLTGYVVDATTIRVYWCAPSVMVGIHAFAYFVSA